MGSIKRLYIPATKSTPEIAFEWDRIPFRISGQSYPENAAEFYEPVIDWLDDYLKKANRPIRLEIELVYLNTSSSKMMLLLLDLLEDSFKHGADVLVRWIYDAENEISKECGEEFGEDLAFPFELIAK